MSRFTIYYRYERVFQKDSINKYELIANVGEYRNFDYEIETKAFQTIMFQSERVSIHKGQKQGLHTLTVLVPWENEEKFAILNMDHDAMIIIASPDYQTVELFIGTRTMISYIELLKLLKTGDYNREIKALRKKGGFAS